MYSSWADCQRAETHARGTEQQAWPHFIPWHHLSYTSWSPFFSLPSFFLSLLKLWRIITGTQTKRKCSVNGKNLQGNSVRGGLLHVTQQQAPLLCVFVSVCVCVCVCVWGKERERQDLHCKSSSTRAAKWHPQQILTWDQNRALLLPAEQKKKKKKHTEAATQFPTDDGINNDQNTKYHHKTAIFADFRCTLKNE